MATMLPKHSMAYMREMALPVCDVIDILWPIYKSLPFGTDSWIQLNEELNYLFGLPYVKAYLGL